MATVAVTLTSVSNKASTGLNAVMPTPDAAATGSATIASSAASQQVSTVVCPDDGRQHYWIITALGNVWVTFGTSPTAVAGTSYLVAAGTTRDWAAKAGQMAAVIDAS